MALTDTLMKGIMNRVPDAGLVLVPGGTLITATPEEGRALRAHDGSAPGAQHPARP